MDIIATSEEPEKIISEFCLLPEIDRILGKGPTKSSIVLYFRVQVDLRVVEKDQGPGAALSILQDPRPTISLYGTGA